MKTVCFGEQSFKTRGGYIALKSGVGEPQFQIEIGSQCKPQKQKWCTKLIDEIKTYMHAVKEKANDREEMGGARGGKIGIGLRMGW